MLVSLAVQRGCWDYEALAKKKVRDTGRDSLPNEEVIIVLLVGENPFLPVAIRCAAQMAKSPGVSPFKLARLAKIEKTERVLAHIAKVGIRHELQEIGMILPVLHDPSCGAAAEASWFSDSPQHLTAEGSRLRSTEVAEAILTWAPSNR
jgi:hypothetical protein